MLAFGSYEVWFRKVFCRGLHNKELDSSLWHGRKGLNSLEEPTNEEDLGDMVIGDHGALVSPAFSFTSQPEVSRLPLPHTPIMYSFRGPDTILPMSH